jgi:hypothetical protein
MTPDPRWLEILKASGWQTAAIAIACALLLWADHAHWLPPLETWMVQLAAAAMVICGLLALASAASNSAAQISKWRADFKEWSDLRHSLETLNADETEGPVRNVVGIRSGIISDKLIISC